MNKKMWQKSRKIASLISYFSIALTAVVNIVLTRVYLQTLGTDRYGLYQMIYAVAQYILLLDMGIGTVMVKQLVEYKSHNDKAGAENFAFHMAVLMAIIVAVLVILSVLLNASIEKIYPSLSPEEYALSHKVFLILSFSLTIVILENYLKGVVNSEEYFVVNGMLGILFTVINFVTVMALIRSGFGIIGIALADCASKLIILIFYLLFTFGRIKLRPRFHRFEPGILRVNLIFMLGMLIQSLSTFANNQIDKTVLGRLMTKPDVAVYAVAMSFITVFNMLPTVFTSLFLPETVRIKSAGGGGREYESLIVRVGRFQYAICGLMLCGFAVCGKDFITLYYGESVSFAWLIAVIIMIPSALSLSEACLNGVIDANNKRMFFSTMVLLMCIGNLVLTILMVKKWGLIGAPLSTAFSYVLYYLIARNYFAYKFFNINIFRMFKGIGCRITICIIVSAVPGILITICTDRFSYGVLFIKAVVTLIVFFALMWSYGFSKEERNQLVVFLGSNKKS